MLLRCVCGFHRRPLRCKRHNCVGYTKKNRERYRTAGALSELSDYISQPRGNDLQPFPQEQRKNSALIELTGYPVIPSSLSSSTDTNSYLRFGTVTIDGVTTYFGDTVASTIPQPAWSPVLGVQHQLDSAASGITINEYVTQESVTSW